MSREKKKKNHWKKFAKLQVKKINQNRKKYSHL